MPTASFTAFLKGFIEKSVFPISEMIKTAKSSLLSLIAISKGLNPLLSKAKISKLYFFKIIKNKLMFPDLQHKCKEFEASKLTI